MSRPPMPARTVLRNVLRDLGGAYTGYMIRHHLRYVVLTFVVIVSAITAINVSTEIARVWAEGAAVTPERGLRNAALYLWCRLLDNGSQAFGVSLLLGLVWSEATHALGGRLLMVRITGLTFLRRSTALLVLASLSVPVQFTLDNFVRPWAYMTLAREGLGEFGWKYARDMAPAEKWYAFEGRVLRATIRDTTPPSIENVLVFEVGADGALTTVASAERILPPGPGRPGWTLASAARWAVGEPAEATFGRPIARRGSTLDLGFTISPLWLAYREIEPKYIPFFDLVALTIDPDLPASHPQYRAWLDIRFMQAMITGLVGLCVATIFAVLLERKGLPIAAGGGLAAAYGSHFFVRLSSLIVENVPLPSTLTAVLLVAGLSAITLRLFALLIRSETA